MDKLLDHRLARLAAWVLCALMTAFAIAPGVAPAGDEMALDTGHKGHREGDPLDTNDAGGDDGNGDDYHDNAGLTGSSADLLLRIARSTRVLLVPEYVGGALSFKLIILPDALNVVEERYAK